MKYDKHIFVCTNDKDGGRKCCGSEHGMTMVKQLQEKIKEEGLVGKIRAQRSGCLGVCAKGPAMVVYPEGVFYGSMGEKETNEIWDEHIMKGNSVDQYRIDLD